MFLFSKFKEKFQINSKLHFYLKGIINSHLMFPNRNIDYPHINQMINLNEISTDNFYNWQNETSIVNFLCTNVLNQIYASFCDMTPSIRIYNIKNKISQIMKGKYKIK